MWLGRNTRLCFFCRYRPPTPPSSQPLHPVMLPEFLGQVLGRGWLVTVIGHSGISKFPFPFSVYFFIITEPISAFQTSHCWEPVHEETGVWSGQLGTVEAAPSTRLPTRPPPPSEGKHFSGWFMRSGTSGLTSLKTQYKRKRLLKHEQYLKEVSGPPPPTIGRIVLSAPEYQLKCCVPERPGTWAMWLRSWLRPQLCSVSQVSAAAITGSGEKGAREASSSGPEVLY